MRCVARCIAAAVQEEEEEEGEEGEEAGRGGHVTQQEYVFFS